MISFVYNFNLRLNNVIRMAMGYRNKNVYKEGRLGGVVISVLAAGPKGRGFKPGLGDEFLRAIKIRSTPSFGWEIKPEVPCSKILRHVIDPLRYFRY
jgi:hypothetical protein